MCVYSGDGASGKLFIHFTNVMGFTQMCSAQDSLGYPFSGSHGSEQNTGSVPFNNWGSNTIIYYSLTKGQMTYQLKWHPIRRESLNLSETRQKPWGTTQSNLIIDMHMGFQVSFSLFSNEQIHSISQWGSPYLWYFSWQTSLKSQYVGWFLVCW